MEESEKKEVFISYSTKNADQAQFLCNQLEGIDISCWIAPRNIPSGEDWANAIVSGIQGANVVALLVSEASMSSKEVAKEIDLANKIQGTTILPIRIENASLQGAFLYHLSNKQWIDALGEDKQSRFIDAVEAIRPLIKKETIQKNVAEGSVLGQAKTLVTQLNQKHSRELNIINAMFSLREEGSDTVCLFFPLRLGATGVDLIFKFNGQKNSIEIYADAAVDGDPLKSPFAKLIEKNFPNFFPKLNKTSGRRWRIIELLPLTELTTQLAAHSPERTFEIFKENLFAFSEKILAKILEWAVYAHRVADAIKRLEEELKKIFPVHEGWCVGAPESVRLADYRPTGKINIYKEAWQPMKDNYQGRGYLSITLESGNAFLDNLYIGIVKYESWLELGEWKQRILDEGNKLLAETGPPEDLWPLWQSLESEWRNSGIAQAELLWKDKFDEFVNYCLDKFRVLKNLEKCLDDACAAIPDLQIREPEMFPPEQQQSWFHSHLYIENRIRKIILSVQEKIALQHEDLGIHIDYRHRSPDSWWNYIYLIVKVGNFDAVVALKFSKNQIGVELTNLEPPDFETPIMTDFMARKFAGVTCDNTKTVGKDCDGGTVAEWMDRVQAFIYERVDGFVPFLLTLKSHLENTVELTHFVEREIAAVLAVEEGWTVENEAKSLEKLVPITIYHTAWRNSAKPGDLPPLVVQLIPEAPCFDDLYLVVEHFGKVSPELERKLGAVCGVCDFAFGKCETVSGRGVWSRKLDDPFHKTGGRWLDWHLPHGDEKIAFSTYLRSIAEKLMRMKPILAEFCQNQNELYSISQTQHFVDRLSSVLKSNFSEEDWQMQVNVDARNLNKYSNVLFYKQSWQLAGKERGELCLMLEAQKGFDNIVFGVAKRNDTEVSLAGDKEKDLHRALSNCLGEGKEHSWWSYYRSADADFRNWSSRRGKISGEGENLESMLDYYSNVFAKLKETATPIIDDILGVCDVKIVIE